MSAGGVLVAMARTVVIGGVGSTLGESVAREFANAGDEVVLWARSESFIRSLAADLREGTPGEALAVPTDVTDPGAVAAAVDEVHEAFGTVDVYVHNAHPDGWEGPLTDDPEALRSHFEVHGYGVAVAVDALLSDLREAGGTVVHNGSERVRWVSRAMAEQLAPEGVHVVWAVVDGWIDGPSVPDDVADEKRADPDEIAAEYHRLVEQDRSVWTFSVDFRPWGDDSFRAP